MSERAGQLLIGAERFQLLSLNPVRAEVPPAGDFHGWEVRGRVEIGTRAQMAEIVRGVQQGIAENNGSMALCFVPRHGIHAESAQGVVDLVICFECQKIDVYVGNAEEEQVLTTHAPEAMLNQILREAGVAVGEQR